jgi:hypothetical protein
MFCDSLDRLRPDFEKCLSLHVAVHRSLVITSISNKVLAAKGNTTKDEIFHSLGDLPLSQTDVGLGSGPSQLINTCPAGCKLETSTGIKV